ncbi:MAG: hypothetical protein SFY67_01285 [Candidatus Melainabacteria bacterium]|nr:hypothetical protein [Candidatus Melainabacteria bacterium]
MYKDGCFYTSSETGLGTLSHEFMHAVFHYTNAKLDPWAHEGLPAFFEKMYGYCEKGQVYFITGFQNPWRIKALGQNLKNLSLEEIVNSSKNQNELRLVSVFLYKKGYLKRFLDISRTGNKGNFNTCFEAAFGRDIRSLEPVWKEYLKDIVAKHSLINQIPGSQFFSSKAKFDSFMQDNGEVLRGLM